MHYGPIAPEACPALVLNADFRPLSYYPLSLWSWQDTIKAVFLDRVNIVSEYDRVVRSPSFEFRLPSVVSLKTYVKPSRTPAFTRFNVFLRDRFTCQYCGDHHDLTFDHVTPRSKGGQTTWENVVTACSPCNLLKGGYLPHADPHVSRAEAGRGPALRSCIAMAASSRRTTCTTAGRTTSTGIPNSIREIAHRPARQAPGPARSPHSTPRARGRESGWRAVSHITTGARQVGQARRQSAAARAGGGPRPPLPFHAGMEDAEDHAAEPQQRQQVRVRRVADRSWRRAAPREGNGRVIGPALHEAEFAGRIARVFEDPGARDGGDAAPRGSAAAAWRVRAWST